MPRQFPRFLFSNPQNTKSKGPFIVHTMDPVFIVRVARCPNVDPGIFTHNGKYILFFDKEIKHTQKLYDATDALYKWIDSQIKLGYIEIPASEKPE